jgi:hypothetical protein
MLQRLSYFFTPKRESLNDSSSSNTPREQLDQSGFLNDRVQAKRVKIERLFIYSTINLKHLRSLLWSGVPEDLRLAMWCYSLGVYPASTARKAEIVEKNKKDFFSALTVLDPLFEVSSEGRCLSAFPPQLLEAQRQLRLDLPRTCTDDGDFIAHELSVQQAVLVWVFRNPGIAYFQGLNDLCVPVVKVVRESTTEAIAFYLYSIISKILEDIQDHYVFGQPGIQICINRIGTLLSRVDPVLHAHLKTVEVDLLTVLFRWINCLFVREFSGTLVLRVWDACIADEQGFRDLCVYVSLAMLTGFRVALLEAADAVEVMQVFRTSPSLSWDVVDVETMLAEAFVLKSVWEQASL